MVTANKKSIIRINTKKKKKSKPNTKDNHQIYFLHTLWYKSLKWIKLEKNGYPFSSVAQSCPTLCDPTNRSTPGLPVHHQLPEFTQTHVH